MSAENKAIIQRLYKEVWNKRKLEVLSELVSPSHALHGPNFSGSAIGPEAYKLRVSAFYAAFPDIQWTIEDTVAEKEKVVACWTFSGTHKGDYMGVPATNKKVSVDGVTIHHMADGKIMDSYSTWDALGLLQQLGVIPASAQPKGATAR
jgi:steroid delta-isomerase-like uncharacterized protein